MMAEPITTAANSYFFTNRAFYRMELGDLDGALADAVEASRLDFENGNAYYCLGSILLELGKHKEAWENLNQAIALHPGDPYFWNKRGSAALALESYEEAMDDFDQAIELKSNLAEAYSNRAAVKHKMGDITGAVSDQSEAINLGGSNSKAIARLAIYNNTLEQTHAPVLNNNLTENADLSQETEGNTSDQWQPKSGMIEEGESFFSWSGASTDIEEPIEYTASVEAEGILSLNNYQHLLKKHHQKTEYEQMTNAGTLLNGNHYRDAEVAFNRILEQNSSNIAAFNGRGLTKYHTGRYETAIKDFSIALQMDPSYVEAYYNRGNALLKSEKTRNALADFYQALQIDPDFAPAYRQRAAVYLKQEKYAHALEDYNKYLKIRPEDAGAYNNRATLKYITGNVFGAMTDYDIGLELNPGIFTMHVNQADLKINCGQLEEALKIINTGLKHHRNSAELWYKRGLLQHKMSNYKAAIADFDQAIAFNNANKGAYYFARGKACKALNWKLEANRAVHLGTAEARRILRNYCLD